jgi:hypothetical protein
MADFTIKEGDTAPALRVQFVHPDGSPVNLTGADVTVVIRPRGGGELLLDSPASIVGDPLDGNVEYAWQPGDTDSPGAYDAEWPTTWALGGEQTFPTEGYTTIEITADLESVVVDQPDQPSSCWPVDLSCCADFDSYSTTIQARAKALAGATLRSLTAYRVGGCPITVRPCRSICSDASFAFGGGSFTPINWNGTWFNCTCNQDTCGCGALCQLELPRPVGTVSQVKVDGLVLDPSKYRVDNGRWLVRTDAGCWPDCQDLAKPDTAVGTFSVTYLNAIPVDALGQYAAGVLACEYAKACQGVKCRLPAGVTSITRQGISMDLVRGVFPDGLTGITEVDIWVSTINPNHLSMAPTVWAPNQSGRVRVTTSLPPA